MTLLAFVLFGTFDFKRSGFMLAADSILRHLPARIQPDIRLRLEALVFAADVLRFAFCSIKDITARYGANIISVSLQDRIALFTHAWTMVDQIHVLRQLIKTMKGGQMGPNQRNFYDTYESATLMRNKMDHLAESAQNLAGRKGMRPPIFGAISYFLVEPHQMTQTSTGPTITSGTIITVTAGSVPSGHPLGALPNPIARPVHPPTSQFMLTAFDWTLDFDEAVTALEVTLNKNVRSSKRECEKPVQG